MSRVSKTAALALAAGLCSAIVAVPAQAKTEEIKSGTTSVLMSPLVKVLLAKTGITVTPVGPAKVGGGSLSMPMASGPMSVPSMNGKMKSRGGLRFSFGIVRVRVRVQLPSPLPVRALDLRWRGVGVDAKQFVGRDT